MTIKPTFGIAKTPFIGKFTISKNEPGVFTYLIDQQEIIGAVLRTNIDMKPVFLSIGNKITLKDCIDIVSHFVERTQRVPILTQISDLFCRKLQFSFS